ncbi:two-component response regulator colocalized with HrtAB transporter [Lachnospiraceae bacterium KM106-2]|nr:two-component response regulator colocalized with HrtAB transporter [Lachnospiraceae bacterium KM106-2]
MFSILVVEDNKSLNKLITANLTLENYHVISAFDGEEALEMLSHEHVDLIISDIMMPMVDGYELVSELRSVECTIPILMITAKDQMEDMEKAFQVGTDDYLVKPVNMKELVLRVRALLRRSQITSEKKLKAGSAILNYDALTITIGEEVYEMPPKEFYLIFKLLSNPNKIYTRLELLDEIWGMDTEIDDRTIDSHIKKLRRKFENYGDFEIVTVRGLGYKGKILR